MSEWTWKQTVAEQIVAVVNRNKVADFDLDEVCEIEPLLRRRFPRNRHVREKIRQTLQRLRKDGLVEFLTGARYRLNLDYAELVLEPATVGETGVVVPRTHSVVRTIRIRNTLLATHIKRRYEHVCQICQKTIQLTDRSYAESHHVRPLGSPHFGPDTLGNILVVCPNHHAMFDYGAVCVDPESLLVTHISDAFEPQRLFILPWHRLSRDSLDYHRSYIFGKV